jgi:hypothetical protein
MVTFQANIAFLGLNSIGAYLSFVARLPLKDARRLNYQVYLQWLKLPFEFGCQDILLSTYITNFSK